MPSAHAIKTWVNNSEETGSTVTKKGGSVKTVRTPQNIDAVRASFEKKSSPVGCASFQETGMMCCVFLCSVLCLKTIIDLFLHMLKYVLPCKCNCIMISNTLNFF